MNYLVILSAVCAFGGNAMDPLQKLKVVFANASNKMKRKIAVPDDLLKSITEFMTDDWLLLKNVFHNTTRTEPILNFVRSHSRNPPKDLGTQYLKVNGSFDQFVEIDDEGRITAMQFTEMGLQDEDIRDLSCVPSKVKHLGLARNQLTTFAFHAVPNGVISLGLAQNKLTKINLDGLPDSVQEVALGDNQLSEVKWTKLPLSLKYLRLKNNQLRKIDLRNLYPTQVREVALWGNGKVHVVVDEGSYEGTRHGIKIGQTEICGAVEPEHVDIGCNHDE